MNEYCVYGYKEHSTKIMKLLLDIENTDSGKLRTISFHSLNITAYYLTNYFKSPTGLLFSNIEVCTIHGCALHTVLWSICML